MSTESPDSLLARLKLGREEYCQRLLTMLILDGPYPRWNTRHRPPEAGARFLNLLEELSFGEVLCVPPFDFIDEFDLGKRPSDLQASAPDWAVMTPDRLWLIELKTERGSHRAAQVPTYVATGQMHYPQLRVDLTYLTGPMPSFTPELPDSTRYAHLTWDAVLPLVAQVWGSGSSEHRAVVDRLYEVVDGFGSSWSDWRNARVEVAPGPAPAPLTPPAPPPPVAAGDGRTFDDPVAEGLALARLTAGDHKQRGVDFAAVSLEELREVGRAIQEVLRDEPDPALAHVVPWLWNVDTSTGAALTASGSEVGYELRLSWYAKPQR